MKHIFWIVSLLIIAASCSDDDDANTNNNGNNPPQLTPREEYIDNVVGLWDLTDVRYSFTLPPFQQGIPPIPLSGQGENVSGNFNIEKDPQNIDYNLFFIAALPNPLTGDSISLPIAFGNSGTYTVNKGATEITVTNNDGTKTVLEILLDRNNRQTYRTVQPIAIPTFDTINVTAELTIER